MFLLIIFSCLLRSRNASSAMPCHAKSIMLSRTHLVLDSFLMLIAFVYLYSYYAVRIDAQWTWAHHKMLHCEWQKIAACLDTLSTEQQPQRKIETNELLAVYTNWPNQRINFNHFQMASRWEGEKILSHFFRLCHKRIHTQTNYAKSHKDDAIDIRVALFHRLFFSFFLSTSFRSETAHTTPIIVCMS